MLIAKRGGWLLRLIGLGLLGVLLWRLDLSGTGAALGNASVGIIVAAIALNVPMLLLKTFRWRILIRCQGASYRLLPAFLAYLGSIFVGFLTPGRLGEFVKAIHVQKDCNLSSGKAFSSVMADRLFDFYALLLVGGVGLWFLLRGSVSVDWLVLFGLLLVPTVPLVLIISSPAFNITCHIVRRLPFSKAWLEGVVQWSEAFRQGLLAISPRYLLMGVALTAAAYAIFFYQSYMVAQSVNLHVNFLDVSYAVALGSLVTLLPISISGLGTREATVVAFMAAMGAEKEAALAFSLLFFAVFYIAAGLMGALAWWIKPLPVSLWRRDAAKYVETPSWS